MTAATPVARRLYDALNQADAEALFDLLADDFEGTVSTGMPYAVGGEHIGRVAMITGVWSRIGSHYDLSVQPSEYLEAQADGGADGSEPTVVVLGTYRGTERGGGARVDAAFAHVIRVRNGRVASLQQITDTVSWHITS